MVKGNDDPMEEKTSPQSKPHGSTSPDAPERQAYDLSGLPPERISSLLAFLKKTQLEFDRALADSQAKSREVQALLAGARSLLESRDFSTAAQGLFNACKGITGATAGYVALLSSSGEENEVLFLDPGGRKCTVDPSLPMPIRGLRAESYKSNACVYDNDFDASPWMEFMPSGHVPLDNVMFAPLVIDGKTVGLIGLANKPGGFTPRDAELAATFGELASVALREKRAEEIREKLVRDLQKALAEIKKLGGLIPICAGCKKIRDDSGYWHQVEAYISAHSEAEFSHGLCPDCKEKLYGHILKKK